MKHERFNKLLKYIENDDVEIFNNKKEININSISQLSLYEFLSQNNDVLIKGLPLEINISNVEKFLSIDKEIKNLENELGLDLGIEEIESISDRITRYCYELVDSIKIQTIYGKIITEYSNKDINLFSPCLEVISDTCVTADSYDRKSNKFFIS